MEEHRPKKMLDQVRDAIRLKHYSIGRRSSARTEQAYVDWIKRYIYFHDVRHPSEMGAPEVEASRSVTHLAVKENVAASTQNQALSALLFLYREVLHQDLGPVDALHAKRPKRLPTVLSKDETLRLIGCLSGTHPQPGWLGCPQPLGFSNYRGLTRARIVIATLSRIGNGSAFASGAAIPRSRCLRQLLFNLHNWMDVSTSDIASGVR